MKSWIAWTLMLLFCVATTLWLALVGFEQVATSADEYSRIQASLDVYDYVGIGKAELDAVQQDVASALRTGEPLNNREVALFGVRQPVFNEREMAHMRDVIALFGLERDVKTWARLAVALFGLPIFVWLMFGGRPRNTRGNRRLLACTGFLALGAWLLMGLVFAAVNGFDFERAFVHFHELLFTNDLWQLDPASCAMIRMYPAEFFVAIARDIGMRMAAWPLGFAALVFVVIYPWRLKKS